MPLFYCATLFNEQNDFLLDGRFFVQRQKCPNKLMTDAVRVKPFYKIKDIGIIQELGNVAASDAGFLEKRNDKFADGLTGSVC